MFRYPEVRYPVEFDGKELKPCAKEGPVPFGGGEEWVLAT